MPLGLSTIFDVKDESGDCEAVASKLQEEAQEPGLLYLKIKE